ncbi:hypothetical protein A9Z40_14325 [Microbacterium arborescens]|uniref:DUF3558 domain-containing protein n=1 Tax=Microbacterium arborescens TaxID=33883 RepID=A0ABX2WK27_9MICO|nr:hypothetical protein [Microbacterium arborescens]OAZ43032.1 hypothetical protein A9Z40_14325 [Microbacterium arborescens]
MLRRPVAFLPLAIAAVLAVGCTPVERAAETPSPVSPSSAAPTPTPTPTPNLEPVRAFDADCDQMLTVEQRDELLGAGSITVAEQIALWEPERPVPVEADPVGTVGGLTCTWFAAEGVEPAAGVRNLTTMVLPAAAVTNEIAAAYSVAFCEPNYDSSACRFGVRAGDDWVSATVGSEVYEAPEELLSAAVEAVSRNLASATKPRPVDRIDQTWSIPDCVELGEAIGLEDIVGPYRHGYWEGAEQPEDVLFASAGIALTCPMFSDGERLHYDTHEFRILAPLAAPGLGWQWKQLRTGNAEAAVAVEVAGAADSFGVDRGYGSVLVYATDGTNVVSMWSQDAEVAAQVLSRMLTALSS